MRKGFDAAVAVAWMLRFALGKDEKFDTKIASYVTKVYSGPMVVEQFVESFPVRHAGADVIKAVQPQVEQVLTKAVEESA